MIRNTSKGYGSIAKFFHWLMALLIIGMFGAAYYMMELPKGELKQTFYGLHKSTGLTLAAFLVLRFIWGASNPTPELPATLPKFQKVISEATIWLLYLCMLAMPLSGFLMSSFGGHPIDYYFLYTLAPLSDGPTLLGKLAHTGHHYISFLFIGLFSLHVLGGLYHHFWLKDSILRRMLPFAKT